MPVYFLGVLLTRFPTENLDENLGSSDMDELVLQINVTYLASAGFQASLSAFAYCPWYILENEANFININLPYRS